MRAFIMLITAIALLTLGCSQEGAKTGEELFRAKCSGCHPDESKFPDYLGENAEKWKEGIKKMIDTGRVQLKKEEIDLIAKFLEEKYRR
uniref:Cytochrome c n=1 Tax=Archaeoglobus fulgidus TaxID=2234 RepID=A0A7C3VI98_ARCFL